MCSFHVPPNHYRGLYSLVGRELDRNWKVARSIAGRNGIFFSTINFLCWLSFRVHPHFTTVARKRPRSFCQKSKWQVAPKQAYTLDQTKSEWAGYAAQA